MCLSSERQVLRGPLQRRGLTLRRRNIVVVVIGAGPCTHFRIRCGRMKSRRLPLRRQEGHQVFCLTRTHRCINSRAPHSRTTDLVRAH